MLKRIVYTFFLLAVMVQVLSARTPMRQWFMAMPDSVMPLLTKNNRLDFIDFLDCGMDAVVTNRLDGKSQLKRLTEDYLLLHYTSSSDVEMKLLSVGDTAQVLCMVTTMKANVHDSRVAFFDEDWRSLPVVDILNEPSLGAFFDVERSDSASVACAKVEVFFKTYALSADADVLKCRLSALDYLSREDRKQVIPYLKGEEVIFRWADGRFVLE